MAFIASTRELLERSASDTIDRVRFLVAIAVTALAACASPHGDWSVIDSATPSDAVDQLAIDSSDGAISDDGSDDAIGDADVLDDAPVDAPPPCESLEQPDCRVRMDCRVNCQPRCECVCPGNTCGCSSCVGSCFFFLGCMTR